MTNTPHNEAPTRRPLRVLSPEQQEALVGYYLNSTGTIADSGNDHRNFCMILLMLDAGLRVAEVCGLRRSNLWFGEGPVVDLIIQSNIAKNGISRTVPLSDRLRESIKQLHAHFWKDNCRIDSTRAWSEQFEGCSITTRQVQRIVKKITGCVLGVCFTPHALRHSFATKMMHLTDIRTVQMLLGHASLTSTQVYTHPTLSDLRAAINKTNDDTPTPPMK
jgi:site-specific recombinase XerD